ncbi:GNAT family N-acetyltransferase [Arthrobacter zhaoguopingii]|uniref:GNAT family N-acetyltransferase n=1 Tax=Arthrobacter zhaoguopingii TaxID=2681491 RepID=UPI001357AD10|nr:GNAT family N-acetyltransferase [Arthrobacter zhaoguopingii]
MIETENAVAAAARAAVRSATDAGVTVRELTDRGDLNAVVSLFSEVWGRASNPPVTVELLRAFAKAGNYIGGAYDGGVLLGASVAFSAAERSVLHSHIAGVSGASRGRSVGFALKLHQRAWAISRRFSEIAWTFDPLVSRNAYFNMVKLAAEPVEYLPDFYGDMRDGINGADASDRLLVRWVLDAPQVIAAISGRAVRGDAGLERRHGAVEVLGVSSSGHPVPGEGHGPVSLVAVPPDIQTLRATDPPLATQWRSAVRDALGGLMAAGHRVSDFDRAGWYILRHPDPDMTSPERTPS